MVSNPLVAEGPLVFLDKINIPAAHDPGGLIDLVAEVGPLADQVGIAQVTGIIKFHTRRAPAQGAREPQFAALLAPLIWPPKPLREVAALSRVRWVASIRW